MATGSKGAKCIALWIRSFCVVFFSSFVAMMLCIAFLVVAGMFQDIGWGIFNSSFMAQVIGIWLSGYALKQFYVCLFIAILVSTKYVLEARAKGL